ncbi:MAG: DNA repair protein RecO [Paracoccaceae bacterium]
MEWQDTGILLTRRKHGESSVIIEVLTPQRGRHAGIVRGGTSRKIAPHLQPGTQLSLHWRARLEDHVGSFVIEPQRSRASAMANRLSLAGLNAVTGLLSFTLPEREACPALYQRTERLLDLLPQVDLWPLAYLQWEVALLADLGFALDLERCAVTGARDGLVYVSPRTGRAVSVRGAGDWADRLLPLPPCLRGDEPAPNVDIATALGTTGYVLANHLAPQLTGRPLPQARATLIARIRATPDETT